jgi:uncharacterized membrane protein YfcA
MATPIPLDLIVYFLATCLAAVVTGVAGFAFGLVASAIWLHVVTPAQSAALIAAYAILIQGATLWGLRHALQLPRLLPFVFGGAVGIPLGALWVNWAPPAQARALIAAVLILFSAYNLLRPNLPALRGGVIADAMVGILGGFFSGSTGLAGIPVIIWATLRRWSKDEQRAVFQPVIVAIFVMTLIWLGGTGAVTTETVRLFLVGLPAVAVGTWLGLKLYGKLDETAFRTVVLVLLLISGLTLLPWSSMRGSQ